MFGIDLWDESEPKDPAKSYTAVYSPTHKVENVTVHPQVDTGLGFSCDEKIVELVVALNQGPLKTGGSCQGPIRPWAMPRSYLSVMAKDGNPRTLLEYLLRLRECLPYGYDCYMKVDSYMQENDSRPVVAAIACTYESMPEMLRIICKLNEESNGN